jgi:hypothetical protein
MNMDGMKCFLLMMFTLLLFSCEEKMQEVVQKVKKPRVSKPVWKPKFYGNTDVPANDSCISTAGMGKVILGQKLDSLETFYDTIESFNQNIDYLEWPAKKIILGKNEWVIASTFNSIGRINMVRTNSKMLHSKNGNHVGMMVSAIIQKDSLGIDQEEKAFIIYPEGIEFRVEPIYEKNFFRTRKPDIRNLNPKAVIREIFIKCGDC